MEDRKTENDNEQEMLRGIQRGDAAAAQALYRSHVRYLSAIASRYIACEEDLRDVLQDCFLKIFSSIASFTYQGPGSLKGWMAKITLNETLKFIRKSGRLEFTELNRQEAEPTDEDPDTEDIPTDAIYRMIRELPDGYRTIFNLHVVEGKKHKEIARLLMYEATKQFKTEKRTIKGWAGPVEVESISGKMVTIVPILRAGLGLMDGVLDMVPGAKISVVGLYRNEETLEPVEYYVKLAKEIDQRIAIILDPMLATGGSLIATIDLLKKRGCKRILSLNLVCAPEGIKRVEEAHPDVDIYTAAVDSHLDEHGYIIPGLGDAGDRIFGTR